MTGCSNAFSIRYQILGLHSVGSHLQQTFRLPADQQTLQFRAPSSIAWPWSHCDYPFSLLLNRHSRKLHKQNSSLSSVGLMYDMLSVYAMLLLFWLLSSSYPSILLSFVLILLIFSCSGWNFLCWICVSKWKILGKEISQFLHQA